MNLTQNFRVILCCALAGLAVGCSGSSGPALKIGVVNLETVLKESGEIDKFQQQATAVNQGLQRDIKQFQAGLVQQYEKKVAEFGATPTDEQKKMLENIKIGMSNQLNQVNQQAQLYLDNMEQGMIRSFRQKMRPVVDKLSEEEKFDLIVEDTGFVIAYDTKLDVSSKVAARLKMELMNNPEGQEGMLPMDGAGAAGGGAASAGNAPAADDPLLKMLSSPSLPPTSAPAGSTPAASTPKTDAPVMAPAAAAPAAEAPETGDKAGEAAETPAGGSN